jgi:hypothetical protein
MTKSLKIIKGILSAFRVNTRSLYRNVLSWSINSAIKNQNLEKMCTDLRRIIPNIRSQFTHGFDKEDYEDYFEVKMRGMHAFQINACIEAVDYVHNRLNRPITIADVGDSSGYHLRYLKKIISGEKLGKSLSVNLDPVAIEKINTGGGEGILCKAEELDTINISPDLFMSFEMLEHLTDPVRFLHDIAKKGSADNFLISVPYRKNSQFGGVHLRLKGGDLPEKMTPEEVHIYEFSTDDWLLLAEFSGWKVVFTKIYWQYPRNNIGRLMQPLWRSLDYEGFFVMFLERDSSLSKRYTGW